MPHDIRPPVSEEKDLNGIEKIEPGSEIETKEFVEEVEVIYQDA